MTTPDFSFTLAAQDGHARAGTLATAHGEVPTPTFMAVGTAGTVKAMTADAVRETGAKIVLGNTYHLMLRPTAERVARLGGLHKMMDWPGPILTDSGGFQIMSLAKLRKMDENGVTFRSHIDGTAYELTPERSTEIQHLLDATITMQLDECTKFPATHHEAAESMRLSTRWAKRSRDAFSLRPGYGQFGIMQGNVYEDLRRESAAALVDMDYEGYAIGGLAVGEGQETMFAVLDYCTDFLPATKPRYLMGVGTPDDLLGAVARGVDMFDCVMPTRAGRTARAFTANGIFNMRNARFIDDGRTLDATCPCLCCTRHTRAYLQHLFRAEEMLGPMLLTIHNLTYYQSLMQGARKAILNNDYDAYCANTREGWQRGPEFMTEDRYAGLQQLGAKTEQPNSPEEAVLERVAAETGGKNAVVRFVCPEFTSLCPMTGQPDFAHIVIDYIPGDWLVESKSLKLFFHAFRNHGGFHEACTLMIADRLIELLSPKWLRIGAYWYPRGGIPIDVFWQTGTPPEGAWIPDQGVPLTVAGANLKSRITAKAAELGFAATGFTRAHLPPEKLAYLQEFLQSGQHGSMGWMEQRVDQRAHPQALWPEALTVISLGFSYAPEGDALENLARPDVGNISVYARNRDYHDIIKGKLKHLAQFIAAQGEGVKVFVDTAPVMEKPLAEQAGLGWQGKHTNLVSRAHGSWLFLGEIYTTQDLTPDAPARDLCGSCTACQTACPTNAFPEPYKLDARRCISYLTIEHDGPIPEEFRSAIGNRIYGCDDCLAVCPWNKFAVTGREQKLAAREDLTAPLLAELAMLDDAGFRAKFSGSPIKRIGRNRFVRNVAIAIGNSANPALLPVAQQLAEDNDPVVAEAGGWAMTQLHKKLLRTY